MSSNAYGRLQVGNSMSNQGHSSGYSGAYGIHGNNNNHTSHQNHGPTSHSNNQNDPNYPNNIPPEDYLDKQNVNNLLRDAVSLLLENRPANPILFMAEHFRNLQ